MRYSKSFIKTQKETPRDADTVSAALLTRAGFIVQEMSGVYSLLPLGLRVTQKISEIIREEMNEIGGQEILMPTLQPKTLWEESGRWKTIDPPLFITRDRHDKEITIAPTHEEVVTSLARGIIESKKDLPQMVYQIQNKFRNEARATGGLLRTREFLMKDAYSFDKNSETFEKIYQKVIEAYRKIFFRIGITVKLVESHSGSIGGEKSNEFMMISDTGEDTIYICTKCEWAANQELVKNIEKCPKCGGDIEIKKAIEVAHIFQLGDIYSKKLGAEFADSGDKQKPLFMGCYGIGIGRLLAAIIEANHDEKGAIWPESIAPVKVYLIDLEGSKGEEVYSELIKSGVEVLFDDREVSAGVKFSDADLLGLPYRIVLSEKTLKEGKAELKKRDSDEEIYVDVDKIILKLNNGKK